MREWLKKRYAYLWPWLGRASKDTATEWWRELVFFLLVSGGTFVVLRVIRGGDEDVISALVPLAVGAGFVFLMFMVKLCTTPAKLAYETRKENESLQEKLRLLEERRDFLHRSLPQLILNFHMGDWRETIERRRPAPPGDMARALDERVATTVQRLRRFGFGSIGGELEMMRQRQPKPTTADEVLDQADRLRDYLSAIRVNGTFDERQQA